MGEKQSRRRKLQRGFIEERASGALRVRVDTGKNPLTGKRHRPWVHVPADTPDKEVVAERERVRLIHEIYERRNPRTDATVSQLLDKHFDTWDKGYKTLENYRSLRKNHVDPFVIAKVKGGELGPEIVESLYAECRRCRKHCTTKFTEHRTEREHECDQRCRPHRCAPLGESAILQIHWMLSGAYRKAKRWKWVSVNPMADVDPGERPATNPQPPSSGQAARLLNEAATRDLDWATLIWVAMITGGRDHELCALRWDDFEVDEDGIGTLFIRRGISKDRVGCWAEQDTKTHQQRRITIDPNGTAAIVEHRIRIEARLAKLGCEMADDAFIFSPAADHSVFYKPSSITQRYGRLAHALCIKTTIHKLRHYSATELIKAGVDLNVVAGRLGHGRGGATTLKYYVAWIAEAEQRAAMSLGTRMPELDWSPAMKIEPATAPRNPYEVVAQAVRQDILGGRYADGEPAPTTKEVAAAQDVSVGTAHRALHLLKSWGLVAGGGRGNRMTVVVPAVEQQPVDERPIEQQPTPAGADGPGAEGGGREAVDLEVVHLGQRMRTYRTHADPNNSEELLALLLDAVRRTGGQEGDVRDYELVVRYAGERGVVTTFIAPPHLVRTLPGVAA